LHAKANTKIPSLAERNIRFPSLIMALSPLG